MKANEESEQVRFKAETNEILNDCEAMVTRRYQENPFPHVKYSQVRAVVLKFEHLSELSAGLVKHRLLGPVH